MCDICNNGVAGHYESKPVYCVECKEGLDLEMANLSKRLVEYAETLHGYDLRELNGDVLTREELAWKNAVERAFYNTQYVHDALEAKWRDLERQEVARLARLRRAKVAVA